MKRLPLLVLALSALAIAGGSGAFSTISADRPVSVGVADDENAYLGIEEASAGPATVGDAVELLTLTNQFSQTIDVEVTSTDDRLGIVAADETVTLDPDAKTTVHGDCESPIDGKEITLSITASGNDIEMAKDYDIQVQCESADGTETTTTETTGTGTGTGTP
jgi:hypothetical protein